MNVVIVGGPHSGVGKTLASERALQALSGLQFGAIKLTVADGEFDRHDHGASALAVADAAGICGRGASCGVCETVSARVPSRTIVHLGAIMKTGTDTWRLANAGAVAVAWIISLRQAAPAAIDGAIEYLRNHGAEGVLIEGTTALDWMNPMVSIMVATDPAKKWKDVALRHVGHCNIVLHNILPQAIGDREAPSEFWKTNPVECDLANDEDPGTQWYVRQARELAVDMKSTAPGRSL